MSSIYNNFVIKVVFYERITYNKSVIKNTKIAIKM